MTIRRLRKLAKLMSESGSLSDMAARSLNVCFTADTVEKVEN
jgi:hypothetical protein